MYYVVEQFTKKITKKSFLKLEKIDFALEKI